MSTIFLAGFGINMVLVAKPVVSIEADLHTIPKTDPSYPGWDVGLKLNVCAIKITLIRSSLTLLANYLLVSPQSSASLFFANLVFVGLLSFG
jgi:hypothetical protein